MLREKEVLGMTQLDNEFFEEYKHLECLCSDMYSCRDGVRQYLEGMESHSSEGERIVPNWKRDYWKLRGLRKTRNVLAHNMSAYQVCTEQDMEDVKNFADTHGVCIDGSGISNSQTSSILIRKKRLSRNM